MMELEEKYTKIDVLNISTGFLQQLIKDGFSPAKLSLRKWHQVKEVYLGEEDEAVPFGALTMNNCALCIVHLTYYKGVEDCGECPLAKIESCIAENSTFFKIANENYDLSTIDTMISNLEKAVELEGGK